MTDQRWSARLADAIAANGVPGASLAILHDGVTIRAVAGVRDVRSGKPVSANTIFRMGSMTKAVTAVLLMRQAEAGRVDLDAPVRAVLPELVLGDTTAAASVTARQLLSHRGGFFGDILDGPSETNDALRDYVAVGDRLAQITPPGTAFSYCNAGFAIVGRMTEVLSGSCWDRAFAVDFARPLGLRRTGTALSDLPDGDVATSHIVGPDGRPTPVTREAIGRAMAPAGSFAWTTPTEMMVFARTLMAGGVAPDGRRLLSDDGVKAMRTLEIAGPTPTFATGWGLGLQRFTVDGGTFGHDGAIAGQNSFLRIAPAAGIAVALFCNGGDARGLFADIFAEVEALAGRPLADPAPQWPESSAVDFDRYTGRYAVPRYAVEVRAHDEGLHARFLPSPDAGDFGAPIDVAMRCQPDDRAGDLFLTRFQGSRIPTQQRFARLADGRRALWFRGRLLPEATS